MLGLVVVAVAAGPGAVVAVVRVARHAAAVVAVDPAPDPAVELAALAGLPGGGPPWEWRRVISRW
jgi:hypothetical protein